MLSYPSGSSCVVVVSRNCSYALLCPALSAARLDRVVSHRRKAAKAEHSCSLLVVFHRRVACHCMPYLTGPVVCWCSLTGCCQGGHVSSIRTISFLKVNGVWNAFATLGYQWYLDPRINLDAAREEKHTANQISLCWPWQWVLTIGCYMLVTQFSILNLSSRFLTHDCAHFTDRSKPQETLPEVHSQKVKSMCLRSTLSLHNAVILNSRLNLKFLLSSGKLLSAGRSLVSHPGSVFTQL